MRAKLNNKLYVIKRSPDKKDIRIHNKIFLQLGSRYFHSVKILHRDIKTDIKIQIDQQIKIYLDRK